MSALITCANCGNDHVTANNDPSNLIPCPQCGSTSRSVEVQGVPAHVLFGKGSAILRGPAFAKVTVTRNPDAMPGILMQSVVRPGERVEDGTIIEAVAIPWFHIVQMIEKDPSVIHKIGNRKWEEMIAGWYKEAGFDEVILTPPSGDLGRDVIAVKTGIITVRIIDQVKAYKPGHLVTAAEVRELGHVLQADRNATKGFITTTSDFAPKIREDKLIKPFIPYRLELVNGTDLIKRLTDVANRHQESEKTGQRELAS